MRTRSSRRGRRTSVDHEGPAVGPAQWLALGTTRRHVQRLVAERRMPFVKVGRFVRFDPAALDVWLDSTGSTPFQDLSIRLILAVECARQTRWPGATNSAGVRLLDRVHLDPRW